MAERKVKRLEAWEGLEMGANGQQGNGDLSPPTARDCVQPTTRMSLEADSSLEAPERNIALQITLILALR